MCVRSHALSQLAEHVLVSLQRGLGTALGTAFSHFVFACWTPLNNSKSGMVKRALRTILSVSLIVVLISQADVNTLLVNLERADIFSFAVALVVSALTVLIRSYKWQLLLRAQQAHLSLAKLHLLNYIAMFFNNFFLGALGGDIFRVYRTAIFANGGVGAISSLVIEKLTNIVALVALAITFGTLCLQTNSPAVTLKYFKGVLAFTILFGAVLYLLLGRRLPLTHLVFCAVPKLRAMTDRFTSAIELYKNDGKTVIASIMLSVVFYLANIIAMYFFALAVDVHVSTVHLSFIVTVVFLIVMMPISVNGIGLQEGTFFLYLSALGIDSSSALLVSLLPRIGMIMFSLIGGLLYMTETVVPTPVRQ